MKLNTRLAIVVTLILTISTAITSAQALIVQRDQKLATYEPVLNNLANQLSETKEDQVSLALLIATQSPIPMSLIYVTEKDQVAFISEDSGSEFNLPTNAQFKTGLLKPIVDQDRLIRYFQINKDEYLAFYLSIASLNAENARSLRSILLFNLLLILIGALLVTLIFRRDSKLNSAAKGMQEFIGDASHELKTPLTVIRGYSELLTSSPDQVSKYAKRINEESLRMTKIIDQLLKISELDERRKLENTQIDLTSYLKSHIEDLLILQPKREITFISEPLMINAPYELIDTIFSNVITNAKVHSPENAPIQISISGKKVTIEDGGPGLTSIPDKPFQRFDSSRSRDTGGSGLGMSLIQKSAKELGAKLNFSKSELGGLKVEITF